MGNTDHSNYVVEKITEVNGLVDDLYEAMMDQEKDDVNNVCLDLINKLKEVIISNNTWKT
jgi:hypothetical protein